MKRLFKLITGELVFGTIEVVPQEQGQEILIRKPYQALDGNIFPYAIKDLAVAPGAIQIHPMNVVWSGPLEDFDQIHTAYLKATANIEVEKKPEIIL